MSRDGQGNLYGVTVQGGRGGTDCKGGGGCGTLFKIAPDGSETILHTFNGAGGGYFPDNAPIIDAKGNLYGTTEEGGNVVQECPAGCGVAYRFSANGSFAVLYAFLGGADGFYPAGGLRMDDGGSLFGNTSNGGLSNRGTVFRLGPGGAKYTLWSFRDGFSPDERLAMDDNYLYGTKLGLPPNHHGSIFRVKK